jgi:histidinol-phosphate aminotransferase
MMDINRLARPEIVAMKPYVSARSSAAADGILLNANESPVTLVDDPQWRRLSLNRYPPPQPAELRARLATLYDVEEAKLLITRGSDEGIDLLTRVFCRPGLDAIVECSPCFGMYRIAASIQGARIIDVPRRADRQFSIDFARLDQAITADPGVRLVFLTSPNNPTGDLIGRPELLRVLRTCEDRALVVMDEAYIEFSGAESAIGLIDEFPQLVVLRTLSKAWAAAGVRCGVVVADPAVIGLLQRIIAPYPMAATAIDAALQAVSPGAEKQQRAFVQLVDAAKADIIDFLGGLDWVREIMDSHANFVLLRVDDADGLVQWCANRGIRIRNFASQPQLQGCVRLTIGSPSEMEAVKDAFKLYGEQI